MKKLYIICNRAGHYGVRLYRRIYLFLLRWSDDLRWYPFRVLSTSEYQHFDGYVCSSTLRVNHPALHDAEMYACRFKATEYVMLSGYWSKRESIYIYHLGTEKVKKGYGMESHLRLYMKN